MKYFIFALLILSMGCSKGFQVGGAESKVGGQSCKVAKSLALPVSVFANQKVDVDAFRNSALNSPGEAQVSSTNEVTLAKGAKVILTVNNICVLSRENNDFVFTQNVKPRKKNKNMTSEDSYIYKMPQAMTLSQIETLADADECLVGVSKNVIAKVNSVPNDPAYAQQTHLSAIAHPANYDFFFTAANSISKDTILAVIDNGVDYTHEDLSANAWINLAEKNGQAGVDDDSNGYVDDVYGYDFASNAADPNHKYPIDNNAEHTHGTHVSGLAAAVTNNGKGVAGVMSTHAKIMALNVFGTQDGANTDNIDTAIRYAADNGANVINMSLGGPGASSSTLQAMQYAVSKGVLILVAAGNDGGNPKANNGVMTAQNFYSPGSYGATVEGLITVGATDANPSSVGTICSFSNTSTTYVELGSPGCDTTQASLGILSTYRNNQYGYMAGTSMASPVAAGFAMVVYSYVRDHYGVTLTPAAMEDLLESGSKNIPALNAYIKNGKNIDFTAIKTKITSTYSEPTQPPTTPPVCP